MINYPIFLQDDGGINIFRHSTSLWGSFCKNLRSISFHGTSKQAIVEILRLSPNLEYLKMDNMYADSGKFILLILLFNLHFSVLSNHVNFQLVFCL